MNVLKYPNNSNFFKASMPFVLYRVTDEIFPPGFLSLPSSSEFYLVNERRTWAEAQRHCRENSSDLASVHHDGDSRRLLMAAGRSGDSGRSAWIGLFDESTVWKLSEDASLEVNTDSLDWMKEQPNNFAGSQHCLYITQTGILNDFFCSTPFHFICYDDRNASRYVLVEVKLSWSEAQAYCRGRHTDLMSLRSREEQEDVRRSLKWAGNVWVGLYRDPWASWSDGSASSFSDWKATQPDNQGRDRQCAAVLLHTGKWVDENCREEKPFFCFKGEVQTTLHPHVEILKSLKSLLLILQQRRS
uniref:C-type lectin domain-containing protein n=1 Tax=Salarias fasciatus TaxID=181472 RepID=A0A672II36_SALFA